MCNNMSLFTTLDQFKDEASCFKVIKLILTGDYIYIRQKYCQHSKID